MVTIREVQTRKDRKRFICFQNQLYRDTPQYIPTLLSDELANLNPKKNPAFEYCEMRFFLAEREGKTVGRIGGIISHKANEIWGVRTIRITRMDFIDDAQVADALVETIAAWGREQGMERIIGPIGFCDLDKEGMLIDGFERQGMFITYYNFPYYAEHMRRMGFEKEVDWTEHIVYVDGHNQERLDKICQRILQKGRFTVRQFASKAELKPYIPQIFELINSEYQKLYGVVPISEKQISYYAGQFLTLINLNYLSVIQDAQGKLVAFGLVAPSMAEAMRKCRGRLLPFGFVHLLKAIRRPKILDMYLVAVHSAYRNTGLSCVLLGEVTKNAAKNGIAYAETGPQLENNYNIQGLFAYYRADREVRRRRCWGKSL